MHHLKTALTAILTLLPLLVLAACSPQTEKVNYQSFEKDSADYRLTYYYQEDRLIKQIEKDVTLYAANNISGPEQAKVDFFSRKKIFKKIKGVSYKIDYGEDRVTESIEIDYTKADLSKLAPHLGLAKADAESIGFISLKETKKHIKEQGYKEVKNGQFRELSEDKNQ